MDDSEPIPILASEGHGYQALKLPGDEIRCALEISLQVLPKNQRPVRDHRKYRRRKVLHLPHCGAQRPESSQRHPYVHATTFSAHLRETTESGGQDANQQYGAISARRLRIRGSYLERGLEEAGHRRRPVTNFVVCVAPFSINLVISRF